MTSYERIREIFLRPSPAYRIDEVAALLGYSDDEIVAAISHGDLAIAAVGELPRVEWDEVALAAVERWPQALIEAALGDDLRSVIPDLARLTDLSVRVPRFGVLALTRLAQRHHTTIDEILARQLLDLVIAESDVLERSVSGLSAAVRWPLP